MTRLFVLLFILAGVSTAFAQSTDDHPDMDQAKTRKIVADEVRKPLQGLWAWEIEIEPTG